jgi:oxaloacetate decarboxylase alpha subunit
MSAAHYWEVIVLAEKVALIDTTTRDGSQSNWAAGMPVGMMDAVLEDIAQSGYRSLDVPMMPLQFKKIIRDLKEDPWEMVRMFGKKAPNITKGSMMPTALRAFSTGGNNREAVKLYIRLIVEMGALNRIQALNHSSSTNAGSAWFIEYIKSLGLELAYAICYYVGTDRHTDEFYAKKTREAVATGADTIYLKDAGGLLDAQSGERIFSVIKENANGLPLEIHSHCTAGMADAAYAAAMRTGCRAFHVGIPPLADGTAQPSVFNTVRNARALGFEVDLDIERIKSVSDRMYLMAKEEGLPADFGPTPYNAAQ